MKRYALKFGPFYLHRYPTTSGTPDPFAATLYATTEAAAADIPEIQKALRAVGAGEVDVMIVQLALAELPVTHLGRDEQDALLASPPARFPHKL